MQRFMASCDSASLPGLESYIAKAVFGKIGLQDKQKTMVVPLEARVGQDGQLYVHELCLGLSRPIRIDQFRVFILHDIAQSADMLLKLRNEAQVKLGKSNKFGNVPDQLGGRPVMEQGVFRHGGTVAIRGHVDTNKFKLFGENMRFC
jgi:hypothetical protein